MPDWMGEAKNLAGEHADVVDKGLDEAEQVAKDKTGGKFDSQIEGAENQAESFPDGEDINFLVGVVQSVVGSDLPSPRFQPRPK